MRPFGRVLQLGLFAALAILLMIFYVDVELSKLVQAGAPDALFRLPIGDFSTLWAAGDLARGGHLATLYDSRGFEAWKVWRFGHSVVHNDWIYPPMALVLGALFSYISPSQGFLIWDLGTAAGMGVLLRLAGLRWGLVAGIILSPAALLCLIYGQYGGIISSLVFAGLVLAHRRPLLAGFLLGLVTLKPQTGLLVPIAWLARRNHLALLAAMVTFLLLAALPVAWFGWPVWPWFFQKAGPQAARLVAAPFGQGYQLTGTSVFWMLRSFGASLGFSRDAQILAAMAAAAGAWGVWRRQSEVLAQSCLTMLLALFVSPYGFAADMVGYTIALAVLAEQRAWRVSLIDGMLFLWPGYVAIVTEVSGRLLTPLVVLLAVIRAARQVYRPASAR